MLNLFGRIQKHFVSIFIFKIKTGKIVHFVYTNISAYLNSAYLIQILPLYCLMYSENCNT